MNLSHERLEEPASEYAPPEGGEKPDEKIRVIFIPWAEDTPQALEWKQKSEQWNHAKKGEKEFKIVYYEEGKTSQDLVGATADPNAVVYVRGHGGPGAPGLLTKMGDKFESLPMEEVCDRLSKMGLGPQFEGAVKFHSCYSGTVFTDAKYEEKQESNAAAMERIDGALKPLRRQLLEYGGLGAKMEERRNLAAGMEAYKRQVALLRPTKESIAKQGADHLRSLGYVNCRYYGYLGPMESQYAGVDTAPAKPEDWHKHVDLEGLQSPSFPLPGGGAVKRVRASVARVRIR